MALTGGMKLIIKPREIQTIVKRLALEIRSEYNGKNPFPPLAKGEICEVEYILK